jgi:hypothetical protein
MYDKGKVDNNSTKKVVHFKWRKKKWFCSFISSAVGLCAQVDLRLVFGFLSSGALSFLFMNCAKKVIGLSYFCDLL